MHKNLLHPCETCRPGHSDEPTVAQLLERISELEEENTRLRKLEQTIETNTHLFEALLIASHESILLVNTSLIVVRLVHSGLGYSEKDILGRSLVGFVHPDDVAEVEACWERVVSGESKNCVIQLRALDPAGQVIWVEAHISDLLDDPSVQAILINSRRITRTNSD